MIMITGAFRGIGEFFATRKMDILWLNSSKTVPLNWPAKYGD
jgi:hypothetical protein